MDNKLDRYRKYGKKIYDLCGGAVGYLVPALEHGRIIERTLLRRGSGSIFQRPFAYVGFDMESGTLLYYKHCGLEDFVDTKLYPPNTVIGSAFLTQRTVQEQKEYEEKLWDAYKKIRDFVFAENITSGQKELLQEYKAQWELTVLKDLTFYYESLSPEFFSWMRSKIQ